jgi:hypothetical protein
LIYDYIQTDSLPRRHTHSSSLEICRQFGLDENEIARSGCRKRIRTGFNNHHTDGKLLDHLPYEWVDADVLDVTSTASSAF